MYQSSAFSWLVLQNSLVLSAAIFLTLLGLILYLHFVKIDQESLLVIGSLGIQVTSAYASGKESTTFIEMGHIKDVVINEAIHMVITQSLSSCVWAHSQPVYFHEHDLAEQLNTAPSMDLLASGALFQIFLLILSSLTFKGELKPNK